VGCCLASSVVRLGRTTEDKYEADSGRHHKAGAFRQSPLKVVVSKTCHYKHPFLS
jgi:hypothetical protein